MRVRVLTAQVPAWLQPHLDGLAVSVGAQAAQECATDLWPEWDGPLQPTKVGAPSHTGLGLRHGTSACYTKGCRRPECREARRLDASRRRRLDAAGVQPKPVTRPRKRRRSLLPATEPRWLPQPTPEERRRAVLAEVDKLLEGATT